MGCSFIVVVRSVVSRPYILHIRTMNVSKSLVNLFDILYLPTFFQWNACDFSSPSEREFPKIYRRLPKITEVFERLPKINRQLPKITEVDDFKTGRANDFQRIYHQSRALLKSFEDVVKTFRTFLSNNTCYCCSSLASSSCLCNEWSQIH